MQSRCRLVFTFLMGLVMCMGCAGESDESTGADAATSATDSVTDVERLQGKWTAVSSVSEGVEYDPAMLSQFSMTITDDVMVFGYSEGNSSSMHFTLDETQSPKAIVMTHDGALSYLMGIYRIEGDRLTLCLRSDGVSPTEFTSEGDGPPALTVYQRSPE